MNSSARSTPRHTPAPVVTPARLNRDFQRDASIVLIGMRGAGKSTLAVIASIACRRRVVDIDDMFQEATGFSSAKYRKQFGASNHNLRQEELLQSVLRLHDKHAIIVCNGGSLERNGQMIMQEFAQTHPVVHIVRDLQSMHEYLGGVEIDRLKEMLAFTAPILRRCSNYEFYNLSEARASRSACSDDPFAAPAFLTMKRAQRTFLKFLSLITRWENADGPKSAAVSPLEPGYPLSDVATELRTYTCAVQVPLSLVLAGSTDIQMLEYGADAFELLINPYDLGLQQQGLRANEADYISAGISKIRRSTVVPIICHVVSTPKDSKSYDLYLQLVRHGLRTVPDFAIIDLSLGEEVLADLIASRGTTKIIGSFHNDLSWADPSWMTHYETAVRVGCALVRFTRPGGSGDDEYLLQRLRHQINERSDSVPLTCYNTGNAGRRSACFNKHLTPVIPAGQADSNLQDETAQGYQSSITARQITEALYASFTFDPMQVYIIGVSLGYSVSPAMHSAAYDCCGMPHRFIPVQSPSLNSLKDLVRNSNFGGSIIVQPFKIEVMSLTDALSPHARVIGAVNTLIPVRNLKNDGSVPGELELFQERNKSGPVRALYGDNTEWIGIRSCVRRGLSPANAVRPTSCGLVIGAGGMARAAVYALMQLGVKNIFIFNRTYERAEKLVEHFTRCASAATEANHTMLGLVKGAEPKFHAIKSRDDAWDESYRQPTIILSCIPADPIDGGPAAQFTLPTQWLQSPTGGVVMEMAYKTLKTPLMQQMREAGSMWTYMDGLDFIPEQAFAQFELFTGRRAPRRVMREEALRAWRDDQGNADAEMVERRLKAVEDQDP